MGETTVAVATGGTTTIQYSWAEAIFPNLEHADIWGYVSTGNTKAITGIRVNTVICPDDPIMVDPTSPMQQLLSYGVNDQFFVDNRGKPYNTTYTPPVGRLSVSGSFSTVLQADTSNLKTRPNIPSTNFPARANGDVDTDGDARRCDWVDPSGAYVRAGKWFDPVNWPTLE